MSNEAADLPEIDIDLSGEDVRAWGGESGPKLPIGKYTMDVVSAVQKPSKQNQPTIEVTFKVADEGEHNGVELTKKYSLQQKALGRIKSLMMACGASLDKIRPAELIGARILVDIVHTEGQGKVDAQGNVVPGGTFCDVINETAMAAPEPAPVAKAPAKAATPPPAAKGPATTAARRA